MIKILKVTSIRDGGEINIDEMTKSLNVLINSEHDLLILNSLFQSHA